MSDHEPARQRNAAGYSSVLGAHIPDLSRGGPASGLGICIANQHGAIARHFRDDYMWSKSPVDQQQQALPALIIGTVSDN